MISSSSRNLPPKGQPDPTMRSVIMPSSLASSLATVIANTSLAISALRMPEAPALAIRRVLQKADLNMKDMTVMEINEAFASVVLSWQRVFDADPDKINQRGGAIALGHPVGATGARLIAVGLEEARGLGGGHVLFAGCAAGDTAAAIVLRVD